MSIANARRAQETVRLIPLARRKARLYQLAERAGDRSMHFLHAGDMVRYCHHQRRALKLSVAYLSVDTEQNKYRGLIDDVPIGRVMGPRNEFPRIGGRLGKNKSAHITEDVVLNYVVDGFQLKKGSGDLWA